MNVGVRVDSISSDIPDYPLLDMSWNPTGDTTSRMAVMKEAPVSLRAALRHEAICASLATAGRVKAYRYAFKLRPVIEQTTTAGRP